MSRASAAARFPGAFAAFAIALLAASCGKPIDPNAALAGMAMSSSMYYVDGGRFEAKPAGAVLVVSEPHQDAATQLELYRALVSMKAAQPEFTRHFYVEGAQGRFDLGKLEKWETGRDKYTYLVASGKMSGWELFALEDRKTQIVGVEDKEVYREQIDAFGDSYAKAGESMLFVFQIGASRLSEKASALKDPSFKAIFGLLLDRLMTADEAALPSRSEVIARCAPFLGGSRAEQDLVDALYTCAERYRSCVKGLDYSLARLQLDDIVADEAVDGIARVLVEKARMSEADARALASDATDADILQARAAYEKSIKSDETVAGIYEALATYEAVHAVALKRDGIMAAKTIEAMKKSGARLGILFIGNAHRKGIQEALAKAGFSYAFLEHRPGSQNYGSYLKRLKDPVAFASATMCEAPTKPILNPALTQATMSFAAAQPADVVERGASLAVPGKAREIVAAGSALESIGAYLSRTGGGRDGDVIQDAGGVRLYDFARINEGNGGDLVFRVNVDIGQYTFPIWGKLMADGEAAERDIANTAAINGSYAGQGKAAPYAAYLCDAPTRVSFGGTTKSLVLYEDAGGADLASVWLNKGYDARQKEPISSSFLASVKELDRVSSSLAAQGKITYKAKFGTWKEIHDALAKKLETAKELDRALYGNDAAIGDYTAMLAALIDEVYGRSGPSAPPEGMGVYHDVNGSNVKFTGTGTMRFIDSVSDVLAPKTRMAALLFKELAAGFAPDLGEKLDTGKASSDKVLELYMKSLEACGVQDGEEALAQCIAFLYLYDFSDSKAMLEKEKDLIGKARAVKGGTAEERIALFFDNPVFVEKRKKNALILGLLNVYADRYRDGAPSMRAKVDQAIRYYDDKRIVSVPGGPSVG